MPIMKTTWSHWDLFFVPKGRVADLVRINKAGFVT